MPSSPSADIGMIGLAVMGRNLALNMMDHGFTVAVWNYETEWVDAFVEGEAKGRAVVGASTIKELVLSLKRPRKVMMMIKAGNPVDLVIEQLLPLLEEGDIVIDGGNSNYRDTVRRTGLLESKGLLYVGSGVSGGEEGARNGPSLMPGGSPAAWPYIKPIFQAIAAKVDGIPCCDWVGEDGAGHFVKMVHNGIEYGDMQIIAEAYHLLKEGLGMDNDEMAGVFEQWNRGKLESYLIEITARILAVRDDEGKAVIDLIVGSAGQKGTGKWTAVEALELGIPLTLIGEAVFSRFLSALVDERSEASVVLEGPGQLPEPDRAQFVNDLSEAVYAAKIISYAQGYMLMRGAADSHGWTLNYGGIAQMWRGGCIIRSVFLDDIRLAYKEVPTLQNLLVTPFFVKALEASQASWRRVVAQAVSLGIPVPAMASALSFFDGYRRRRLPANMIQAQRDYFGAHTYERLDRPRGEKFHTNWTGEGGEVTSGSYSA